MRTEQWARMITTLTPLGSRCARNLTPIWFRCMPSCFLSFELLLNQTGIFREEHALSFLGLLYELMWLVLINNEITTVLLWLQNKKMRSNEKVIISLTSNSNASLKFQVLSVAFTASEDCIPTNTTLISFIRKNILDIWLLWGDGWFCWWGTREVAVIWKSRDRKCF